MPLNRKDLEARYELFNHFALNDQRNYYKAIIGKHRKAATQINSYRAMLSLLTGLTAALAGLIVQVYFTNGAECTVEPIPAQCPTLSTITTGIAILAVFLPALGALLNTLSDLYQWDRLITIYSSALENIELADAQSPEREIPDELIYRAAFNAFAEGTLSVMNDETAQWGQAIRTPAQLEKFVEEEKRKLEDLENKNKPQT
jgi:hypothetical protein